ncbi:MAG: hypothetical protein OEM39_06790 [Acidimicrobiia bacterium]|nr:hypothetical protein [Acidimicrobiia bacterium]
MKVVAIPFQTEDPATVVNNVAIAARHERIDQVWAVGPPGPNTDAVREIGSALSAKVLCFPEDRIGTKREGKGDAMNTALLRAATESVERLHFYDADITNFGESWIWGAERAADCGFSVVRHTFARASTDAMITWNITKPLLAMKYPGTILPRIGQPLGGEILLSAEAIQALAGEPRVLDRSDWGIDTLYTYTAAQRGFSLFEHHVPDGKRHALYGSLDELKLMVIECFDAAANLPDGAIPDVNHDRDPPAPVPEDLQREKAYDVEASTRLLTLPWVGDERATAETLPEHLSGAALELTESGDFSFLDEQAWEEFLLHALRGFGLGDPAWESLLFRLWVGRVLNYTTKHASRGYRHAMSYLEATVAEIERNALHRSG